MTTQTFRVNGRPVGQGNHSRNAYGAVYETSKGHRAWRDQIRLAGRQNGTQPLSGPISVTLVFELPRPQAHWAKRGGVKDRYAHTPHTTRPDIDKLTRAALDALTDVAYHDDSQVVKLHATKTYGEPGLTIIIEGRA